MFAAGSENFQNQIPRFSSFLMSDYLANSEVAYSVGATEDLLLDFTPCCNESVLKGEKQDVFTKLKLFVEENYIVNDELLSNLKDQIDSCIGTKRKIDLKIQSTQPNNEDAHAIQQLKELLKEMQSFSDRYSNCGDIFEFDVEYPFVRQFNKGVNRAQTTTDNTEKHDILVDDRFNTHNILIPSRPAENSLADIIFHEKVCSNQEEETEELVQFWIDTKHRNTQQIDGQKQKCLKAATINSGLKSYSLWRASRRETLPVRHVVHIIITPLSKEQYLKGFNEDLLPTIDPRFKQLKFDVENTQQEQKQEQQQQGRPQQVNASQQPQQQSINHSNTNATTSSNPNIKKNKTKYTHRLKSYRLILVNPDDLNTNKAFENLVSQPIALTIPLMEQQLAASGTNKLPPPQEWWSYRATNVDTAKLDKLTSTTSTVDSGVVVTAQDHFADWRQSLHDQDLAMGIGHKFFASYDEAKEAFVTTAQNNNNNSFLLKTLCDVPFAIFSRF